jgi:hypothetical protein
LERNEMMASATEGSRKPARRGRPKQQEKPVAKVYSADELARRVFWLVMCGIGLQISVFAVLTFWAW